MFFLGFLVFLCYDLGEFIAFSCFDLGKEIRYYCTRDFCEKSENEIHYLKP